ncbi:hypothetical protein AB205_0142180 [Aquarana catesbeiana]|uniref:E3 ubiquitin-protein ligase RNF123/RKP TPR repeat domain-containing protein n=1 Tax=Aquarana catesbeiana TaxID=8400 RepID=A0A2G9R9S5_AQUCT|nr:hypothetical protein AB205_0142180 [Aquarana catesbeiana]
MVCFLHRLITALRASWDEFHVRNPSARSSEDAYVPPQLFYNGKVDYFDLQRLGGLLSHLRKTLKDDLSSKANIVIDPSELQAVTMDDLEEEDESASLTGQRPSAAQAIGGALARPSWLSSPTLGRANRFLSTAAVSLMNPRRPLGTLEKMKVRSLSLEQRTEDDIEGHHGNEGLLVGRPPEEPDIPITENSLLEMLDGVVMMYNLSVHQQLGKMVGVSDDVNEYALALKDTEEKIKRCPKRRPDIMEELLKSQQVFSEKLNHLSRRLAWINVTIYSKEKMEDIYWLLQVCLRSIEHADRTGSLFAFMPEYYLNVAMNSYNALKNYFSPIQIDITALKYGQSTDITTSKYGQSTDIAAPKYGQSTDITTPKYGQSTDITAPKYGQSTDITTPKYGQSTDITAPKYGQRTVNAFHIKIFHDHEYFSVLPGYEDTLTRLAAILAKHFADSRIVGTDIKDSLMQALASYVCYPHSLRSVERISEEQQISMMKSLLAPYEQRPWAQTNWILVRLWRIQQAAERLERNFVDSRQLKVCATCFDLSVSLLRVLEMTVTLVPEIFLDWSRSSSELLLRRLAQLLNQVLNRVTAERNLFDRVVSLRLPGLESVDHYPILVAVTGILVRLLVDSETQGCVFCVSISAKQFSAGKALSDPGGSMGDLKLRRSEAQMHLDGHPEANDDEVSIARKTTKHRIHSPQRWSVLMVSDQSSSPPLNRF